MPQTNIIIIIILCVRLKNKKTLTLATEKQFSFTLFLIRGYIIAGDVICA